MKHREFKMFTVLWNCPLSRDTAGITQSSGEPVSFPLSLNVAGIIAESQRRPDQDIINRIDKVLSIFQHLCTGLMWIPDAGPH